MLTKPKKTLALPAAAAFASALMVGCAEETPVQEAEESGPIAEAAILAEPVTFQAEVMEIVGPNVMTVGEDETPIVGADAATLGLEEGDMAQITGTVRQIVEADLESEWGFDFDDDELAYLVERELDLGVIATDVQELPEE